MANRRRNEQAEVSGVEDSATPEVARANEHAAQREEARAAFRDGNVVLDTESDVNPNQDTSEPGITPEEAGAANMARIARGEDPVADGVQSDDPHSGAGASPENSDEMYTDIYPADRIREVPSLTPNAVTAVPTDTETHK